MENILERKSEIINKIEHFNQYDRSGRHMVLFGPQLKTSWSLYLSMFFLQFKREQKCLDNFHIRPHQIDFLVFGK